MSVTVHIDGLDKLQHALDPVRFARAVTGIRLGVAEEVRDAVARYPGPVQYPIQWASARQRRWFFWAVRNELIEVPYVRQSTPQRLGSSWTVAKDGKIVGTTVTYAPYVQSHKQQQPFHCNTGWVTDKQAAESVAESGVIGEIAQEVLRKFWR